MIPANFEEPLIAGPHGPKTSWLTDPDGYRIEIIGRAS